MALAAKPGKCVPMLPTRWPRVPSIMSSVASTTGSPVMRVRLVCASV